MLSNKTKVERWSVTTIDAGANTTEKWLEVGKIVNLTPPAMARDAVEVTHYGSETKEFSAGFRDGGEMTLELLLEDSSVATDTVLSWVDDSDAQKTTYQELVFSDFAAGEAAQYRITLPDVSYDNGPPIVANGKYWKFDCIVTGLSAVTPLNDKATVSVTLKVVGKPSYDAPTA